MLLVTEHVRHTAVPRSQASGSGEDFSIHGRLVCVSKMMYPQKVTGNIFDGKWRNHWIFETLPRKIANAAMIHDFYLAKGIFYQFTIIVP